MSLFSVDSSNVDKGVSSLFKSSVPRQRPVREQKKDEIPGTDSGSESDSDSESKEPEQDEKDKEEDDEEISELEDELDDEEEDVGKLLSSKKRKRDDDTELEDRYIQKLAEDAPESEDEKDEPEKESKKSLPEMSEVEKAEKTVFVGNVVSEAISNKKTYRALKSEFQQYGKVQSIRFRSIAFSEIIPRKAAFLQQKLHPSRDTVNAYVVFDTKEECKAALKLNGAMFQNHHLRVDSVSHPAQQDPKRSVFIGNLDFEQTEEPVWKYFENKCGAVEYVRLIRDSKTNVGKGFGYVQFTDSLSVNKALLLNDKKMDNVEKGRKLRVSRAKNLKKRDTKKDVKKARLSNDQKTQLGRAKNMVGKASKAKIDNVIEGTRAKVGDTVGLKKPKKPRIRERSTNYKKRK